MLEFPFAELGQQLAKQNIVGTSFLFGRLLRPVSSGINQHGS